MICGVLLVAGEIRAGKAGAGQGSKQEVDLDYSSKRVLYGKIGLTVLAGVIYGFLLDPIGYLISTFVFMMILMCLVNTLKRMPQNIIIALGFSMVTYLVFATLFKVSLPRGILAF